MITDPLLSLDDAHFFRLIADSMTLLFLASYRFVAWQLGITIQFEIKYLLEKREISKVSEFQKYKNKYIVEQLESLFGGNLIVFTCNSTIGLCFVE